MIAWATILKNYNGTVIKTEEGDELSLGLACVMALGANYPEEQQPGSQINGVEKLRRDKIARKIMGALDPEKPVAFDVLPAADIDLIERLTARLFSPVVIGQVWPAIDPAHRESSPPPPPPTTGDSAAASA